LRTPATSARIFLSFPLRCQRELISATQHTNSCFRLVCLSPASKSRDRRRAPGDLFSTVRLLLPSSRLSVLLHPTRPDQEGKVKRREEKRRLPGSRPTWYTWQQEPVLCPSKPSWVSVFPFLISTLLSLDSSSTANQVLGIPSACCVALSGPFPSAPPPSLCLPLLSSSFASLLFLSCSAPIRTLFAGLLTFTHSSAADVYRPYQVSSSSTIPFLSIYLLFFDLFDPLLFFSLSHSSYSFVLLLLPLLCASTDWCQSESVCWSSTGSPLPSPCGLAAGDLGVLPPIVPQPRL
jgi:hypothetical protein